MSDDVVMHLTLAGGKTLRIRSNAIIAAHEATKGESHEGGKTKIYLSSGKDLFVREAIEDCVIK